VGGEKKKRVYGIGSSNSSYYPGSSSSASSSAPHNAQLELQIKQLQDELHQMRQQHQEERSQMEQQQEEERRTREQQTRDEVTRLFNEQMQQWMRSNPRFGPGGDGSGVG
jgi:TolA-binding protein